MHLIIGLGNPGKEYTNTRHNLGFTLVDLLANRHNIPMQVETKLSAIVGKGLVTGVPALLAKPLTYMNKSGEAMIKVLNWYKIPNENMLVLYDDISLSLGTIKYRKDGRDAGHNGIKSMIAKFGGNNQFSRLKLGIGPDPGGSYKTDFVLSKFKPNETKILDKILPIAIDSVEYYLQNGIEKTMNEYNKYAKPIIIE